MKFLRTHDAVRFIQIFEADGETVYRLLLPQQDGCELDGMTVRCEGTALAGELRRWDPAVVSLRLAGAPRRFEVRAKDGTVLARMTPSLFEELTVRRDLCMVNPGIDGAYGAWLESRRADAVAPSAGGGCGAGPLLSLVVPLYRTPLPYFHAMVQSVLAQTYRTWELVLVNASPDDGQLSAAVAAYAAGEGRVRVVELAENRGIAANTNAGIRAAQGAYVGFLDHDDLIAPRALEEYARCIGAHPDVDLLYCDEDSFHEGLVDRYEPRFKPAFNNDLLYSHNYLVHLLMVSRWALERVELSPDRMSGAQDYDLSLKVSEVARTICHIPQVLYHWRAHAGSTNGGAVENKPYAVAASICALDEHFARRGIGVEEVVPTENIFVFSVHYRARREPVDVVVAFEDGRALERLLVGLAAQAAGWVSTVVAVGPCGAGKAVPTGADDLQLALVPWDAPFDFAAMVNAGVARLTEEGLDAPETLLVCHATVVFDRVLNLGQLAGCLTRPDAGIVAPKLFYPDGLVQHAGLCVLPDGTLGFLNQNFREGMGGGYLGLAECSCAYSAVGPDCFMLRRTDLEAAGGLDERYGNALLAVADLSFKLRAADKAAIVLPESQATAAAPVVWEGRSALAAYGRTDTLDAFWETWSDPRWRHDVLENPNTTMEHGYINLDTGRDIDAETRRVLLLRRLKGLMGRS